MIKAASLFCILFVIACNYSCNQKTKEEKTISSFVSNSITEINEEIEKNPNNPDLIYLRAKYYFEHQNLPLALKDAENSIKLDSTKSNYYLMLSDIYFSLNRTRESKLAIEKSILVDPKNTEGILKLAELYFYVRKYQEAMDNVNTALKINKSIAKGYFIKGMIYKELRDTAKAISSMETVIELDQEYYAAYMELGVLFAQKKNKLALDYFNNALKLKPESEEVLYAKSKFYQDIEEWDNAIKGYQQLLQLFPNNKYAYYNQGVILFGVKEDYKNAIKYFNEALIKDSTYYQSYFGRGSCYEALGNIKMAQSDFNSALKINPKYIPAKDRLSKISL